MTDATWAELAAKQGATHVNIQNPRAPLYPPERVLSERGFAQYGDSMDTYGTPFKVAQSSAAGGDYVWLFANVQGPEGNLHLNVDNVRWLRERLGEFLDDVGEAR